jgi:hypothetical protein
LTRKLPIVCVLTLFFEVLGAGLALKAASKGIR